MNAKEKLIGFLEKKGHALSEIGAKTPYFTEKDKKAIKKWSEKDAKFVLEQLIANIESAIEFGDKEVAGLSTDVCPFCIKHGTFTDLVLRCGKCEYGKEHGKCFDPESDVSKIVYLEAKQNAKILNLKYYGAFLKTLKANGKPVVAKKAAPKKPVAVKKSEKTFVPKPISKETEEALADLAI